MRIKRNNNIDIKIKIVGVDVNIINAINKIISVSKIKKIRITFNLNQESCIRSYM